MRLASSWMVITSGMITSRMTLSRGCTTPAWRSFSRSRRRCSEASERSRCASSKALLMVSLMRSRRSSAALTGLLRRLGALLLGARLFLGLGLDLERSPAALGDRLGAARRAISPALAFSAGRGLGLAGRRSAARCGRLAGVSAASGARRRRGLLPRGSGSGFGRSASRRARSRSSASARSFSASSARRRASSSSVDSPPVRCAALLGRRAARPARLRASSASSTSLARRRRSCASSSSRRPPTSSGHG